MKVFAYYETDGDAGWYNVHLFHTRGEAEEFKKRKDDAYGQISELEVETIDVKLAQAPSIKNLECPECGGEMVSRKGLYGMFWGCKRYPSCKGTRDNMGRSKEDRRKEKEESDQKYEDELNGPNKYPFRRN